MPEENADMRVFEKAEGTFTSVYRLLKGIFLWPSWDWQRGGLFVSMLLGAILLLGFPQYYALFGFILLTSGLHGGFRAKWLNRVNNAMLPVKVSTGFCYALRLSCHRDNTCNQCHGRDHRIPLHIYANCHPRRWFMKSFG
ncbi:MAG: hypothetical protein ACUVTL_05980 [Thermoproteota archaeon]